MFELKNASTDLFSSFMITYRTNLRMNIYVVAKLVRFYKLFPLAGSVFYERNSMESGGGRYIREREKEGTEQNRYTIDCNVRVLAHV